MTRWTTCLILAFGWVIPVSLPAQDPWGSPPAPHSGYFGPQGPGYVPGPACPPYRSGPRDPYIMSELVPKGPFDDADCDAPGLLPFKESLAQSWIRFDYLLWDIRPPENARIGAQTLTNFDASGRDPTTRRLAQGPDTRTRTISLDPANPLLQSDAFITVVNLNTARQNDINGGRISFGIPTNAGTLEAETWLTQKDHTKIVINPVRISQTNVVPLPILIPAIPLLNNGVPADDRNLLFTEGMTVRLETSMFGTEGNWVFNANPPNTGIDWQPLLGFRYIRLEDGMHIYGRDIDISQDPTLILDHDIRSLALNHVFGPQLGLRATTKLWRFTLGAETKFVIGLNRLNNQVRTDEILRESTPTDPDLVPEQTTIFRDEQTRFAPFLDLSLYSKFHMSDNFALFVAYDLIYGGGISRAYDNVIYDTPASLANDPPAIRLDGHLTSFYAQGLVVGGEFTWK